MYQFDITFISFWDSNTIRALFCQAFYFLIKTYYQNDMLKEKYKKKVDTYQRMIYNQPIMTIQSASSAKVFGLNIK